MPLARPLGIDSADNVRRAAQYVRMSTDMQEYSIENQAAAIAAYAARRNLSIVQTYADRGRSGLDIGNRAALSKLIRDVRSGKADFECILVYDVSRWGRFQDTDESAYYEYICKEAGIEVVYCAEQFENDGTIASVILKNIKRVMAGEYSRELSAKVFGGQCRGASQGFWQGGPAGYGFRRLLLDEHGKPKLILKRGQRKNLKTERVILVPGPPSEARIVQRIFRSFAIQKKTRTEIACELNAEHVCNARGRPWSMLTISNILKNEAYVGHLVYNRRSLKLHQKQVRNPAEMWVRRDNAFKPIVRPDLFAKAQKALAELEHGRTRSDEELLEKLAALLRRKGRLSMKIMQAAREVPHWTVYTRRFGSLMNTYRRVGYKPQGRYSFAENAAKIDSVICAVAGDIAGRMEKCGRSATFLHELYLLTLGRNLTVVVAVAWSIANGSNGIERSRRWEVRKIRYKKSDLTLVVRMDASNSKIQDYFLVPTANLPFRNDHRIRISDRVFGRFAYDDFESLMRALHERLGPSEPPPVTSSSAVRRVR